MNVSDSGSLDLYYQLTSDLYIPERMVRAVDKATVSMKENGLHTFYESFGSFLMELRRSKKFEVDKFVPMKLYHILIILMLIGRDLCFSILVLVIEIIVHGYKQFRSRRIAPIRRH